MDDSGTFLPLGIDTDNINGCVYVCDYRNSCVIKFDDKLEFITQWRIYNHSDQYDEGKFFSKPLILMLHPYISYVQLDRS